MRILLDTNIVLDVCLKREGFYQESYNVFKHAIMKGDRLFLSSSAVTDVYYVIRKSTASKNAAIDSIKRLAMLVNFAEVNEKCILSALDSPINDYEDAVVDMVASSIDASFIVTRNISDFKKSRVKAITPQYYCSIQV